MKYTVISKTDNEIHLDYKTPMWFYPLLLLIVCLFIAIPIVPSMYGQGEVILWVFCLFAVILMLYVLSAYCRKRPITIDYINSCFTVDGEVIPFSDVKDIEVMSHLAFIKNGFEDNKFPYRFISSNQTYTTYFAVVITTNKTIRVNMGFKSSAKKEAIRFKEYLKVND